ncbi:MAG: hypothetical protein J2P58_05040 [Acidimicrobiaceae bacterium]|nr:hypothetical protein [Acidimicrobiaceae bacterium]
MSQNGVADEGMSALVERLAAGIRLPKVGLVAQRSTIPALEDVAGKARTEVRRVLAAEPGAAGDRGPIAVGVGSRGIAHLAVIVGAVVDELKGAGYRPFVVPAMGSHGGGTPEGQLEVLSDYGISEATLGVPMRATMETRVIGDVDGVPVHLDRFVAEAGKAFLVARVKPHTDFRGPIESGPTKMAAIGLGKQAGAATLHGLGLGGLRDVMPEAGRLVARRFLLGALAIVENDADETASITGLPGAEVGGQKEMALLDQARACLPRIPFANLDVLLIEQIGKDVSGSGMDPNVAGRWMINGLAEPEPPPLKSIVALDLTDASHGNALGMGLADFTTERLVAKLVPLSMVTNAITSGWAAIPRSRMPIVMPDDRSALIASLASCGTAAATEPRLVWIRDTLHTTTLAVSDVLWREVGDHPGLEPLVEPFELPFETDGSLRSIGSLGIGVPTPG